MKRDKYRDKSRDNRDIFSFAHVPLPGQTGHPPFRDVPVVPVDGECPGSDVPIRTRQHQPEPFSRRDDRRRAWDAWLADGKPWPPPAGLTNACVAACLRGDRR